MKIVKIFVLLLYCVINIEAYRSGYCKICQNHTLCKYPVGGPGAECRSFDKGALLTDGDIVEILNRINSRRNLVAIGRLDKFPQAANMKRVHWSSELAIFAQRWADQCHPSIRPNKEDECRDLEDMQVGQNIATISGPTPGLNVKSFVDMWFMLKLHYTGTIVYYNQSHDERTNHFTQLIWSNTEYVGCGKVKFFNQKLNNIVERLVCNFAPKGNNHGKPVYTLGYPATQCPNFMGPDNEYPGLCERNYVTATEIVRSSSVSSLLRILNLSNNSVKHELDPNNFKQISLNSSEIKDQRNQKTRHVYSNNSYGAVKRDSFHIQNPINEPENFKVRPFTPERGHSRMYHGYQTQKKSTISNIPQQSTPTFIDEHDFRRYELTQAPYTLSSHDYRRDFLPVARGQQCTRKSKGCDDDCHVTTQCITNQCTRGEPQQYKLNLQSHSCNSCAQPPVSPIIHSHQDTCPCNKQSKCSTVALQCDCNAKCQCINHNCPTNEQTTCCDKRRSGGGMAGAEIKSTQFNYYDLFPNIGVRRAGDDISQKHFNHPETQVMDYKARDLKISNQVKEIAGNLNHRLRRPQDSYNIFYSSERKRRDVEDQMTFKPFWQMDEYNYKRPAELKSLRYTTLGNKRNKKTKRTIHAKVPTESITIQRENEYVTRYSDHITEKYLSFEELMRLRKLSTQDEFDYNARRVGDAQYRKAAAPAKTAPPKPAPAKPAPAAPAKPAPAAKTKAAAAATTKAPAKAAPAAPAKPATAAPAKAAPATTAKKAPAAAAPTKAASMTTITANTPFIRLKQCTRKLTCTWTAITVTLSDGRSMMAGGGGMDIASRTPQGYVDGCSRTSTCTRDFMDRNKMESTTEEPDHESTEESTNPIEDDGDYCEKRSLDIRRRNIDNTEKQLFSIEFQEAFTETPTYTPKIDKDLINSEKPVNKHSECICYGMNYDNTRFKRGDGNYNYEHLLSNDCNNLHQNKMTESTYDEPYHSMLQKISISSKYKNSGSQCPCNSGKSIKNTIYWAILLKYCFTWACYSIFMSNFKS